MTCLRLRCPLRIGPPRRHQSCLVLMLLLPLLVIALLPASSNAQLLLSTATSVEPGATAATLAAECQPPFFDEGKVNTHQGKSLILKDVCLEQVRGSDGCPTSADDPRARWFRRRHVGQVHVLSAMASALHMQTACASAQARHPLWLQPMSISPCGLLTTSPCAWHPLPLFLKWVLS